MVGPEFGFGIMVWGFIILASFFAPGFLSAFITSFTYLHLIKRSKKVGLAHKIYVSVLMGIVGGMIPLWLAYRLDNYYGHKAYIYNGEFSLLMQERYKIVSASYNRNTQNIHLSISVPINDVYNVRVYSRSGRHEDNRQLPLTKDFWKTSLEQGINELNVKVGEEYLTKENLYLVVIIYPNSKRIGSTYTYREMNSLFKENTISLYEGIEFFAPEIPRSFACNNFPRLPCVKEEKLKVELN